MKKHTLKTLPIFFSELWAGRKTFEIRKNDRNFKVGDVIRLQEFTPDGDYTGREIEARVKYITEFAQKEGYVVMAIAEELRRW